jgi:transposase-like protein
MEEQGESQAVKRTQRDYSLAFKLMVVEEMERGDLSYRQLVNKYGIQGRSTVLKLLRKHVDWIG